MQASEHKRGFILGNILLGISLVLLLFMGSLWEYLGAWAMGLWMILAGIGMYFVMGDKRSSTLPD
jgi:hypothetical protein